MPGSGRVMQRLRAPLVAPPLGLPLALAWHGGALLLVLLAPTQLWRGLPAWTLAPAELVAVLLGGGAYLALALLLTLAARRPAGLLPGTVLAAIPVCYCVLFALLWLRRDLPTSWGVMAVAAAVGILLAVLPWLAGRVAPWALWSMAVALAALGVGGWTATARPDAEHRVRHIGTALHLVELQRHPGLLALPMESDGGGLAAADDDFLLVTGAGQFYRLAWSADRQLRAERLDLVAPLERPAFLAAKPRGGNASRLRVTDLLVESSGDTARLFVAHQFWHGEERCFTLRVSATELRRDGGMAPWRTVYDSRPCLKPAVAFDDSDTGGRLAFAPGGGLLLTIGDHGFHGTTSDVVLAQDAGGDYGKILLLDGAGGARIFSRGHRNPQGLTVDRAGRIWSTEHGPQGGDEINLVSDGGNYGWPLATYGTDYGLEYWPAADGAGHGPFVPPVHAFVPSVGISDLIQVAARQFPRWDGDLLVASLRAGELLRVRLDGTRVAYVESIPVGRRIRDLAQGSDGRILLWIDDGELVSLAAASRAPSGEAVYRRCAGCHEESPDGVAPSAPALHGIVGRQVAAAPGFTYSDGLRRAGGDWNRERLDAFLADPATFAPGTPMQRGAVPDGAERRAVIDYLARRK